MRIGGWFGISWYAYACICVVVAVSYGIFSVEPVKGYDWAAQPVWRYIILRWFHSLVWVLLGIAALIMQISGERGVGWAKALGLLGLFCYILYVVILFVAKNKSAS